VTSEEPGLIYRSSRAAALACLDRLPAGLLVYGRSFSVLFEAVAARLLQILQLIRRDFAAMRPTTALLVAANPNVSHVRGMHAFALAWTGEIEVVDRSGQEAADAAFDPWTEHPAALMFASRRGPRAVLAWLLPLADGRSHCSSLLYTHNRWHVALAHLACCETETALALFNSRIQGVRKSYCLDQVNEVSLLKRLQLVGVDAGDRCSVLAEVLAQQTTEHLRGSHDLHYLLGLARAGHDGDVETMQHSPLDRARRSTNKVWREIVLTAADGLVAHAHRQWQTAARLLDRALPRLVRLGVGSVKQELFVRPHAHARSAAA
jgi:hypothetical protein